MTPQQKRVLAASKAFDGTCSADWINDLGTDGRGKISRVPARIEELEDEYGCVFEVIGRRNKTKVFRLVSGPDVEAGRSQEPSPVASRNATSGLSAEPRLISEPDVERTVSVDTDPSGQGPSEAREQRPATRFGEGSPHRLFDLGVPVSGHYDDVDADAA